MLFILSPEIYKFLVFKWFRLFSTVVFKCLLTVEILPLFLNSLSVYPWQAFLALFDVWKYGWSLPE